MLAPRRAITGSASGARTRRLRVHRDKLDDALNRGGRIPGADPVSVTQPPPFRHDEVIKRKG
jgi:hypothetical protein